MTTRAALATAAFLAAGLPLPSQGADAPRSGEQVVQFQCVLCHGQGLGGAPRLGDRKAWDGRARAGLDNLVRSAIRGRGAMPPSGGLADLTEAELRSAIEYMLRRSGVEARAES